MFYSRLIEQGDNLIRGGGCKNLSGAKVSRSTRLSHHHSQATCPSGRTTCSKGATRLDRFCHATCPSGRTTCSKGATRGLVILCATCPSGCTTCSKGATRWLDGLVDSKTPGVNTPPGESCGRLRALRNKAPALLRAP
jgi:hypothetical protein